MAAIRRTSPFWAAGLGLLLVASAQAGQKHPGYLRTMDDLRYARTLLDRPDRPQAADTAPDEVSLTIGNIDRAMDGIGKEVGAGSRKAHPVPRIDQKMNWGARLSESLRVLERAEEDCAKEKDDAANAGLLAHVTDELNQARTRLIVAIQTINFDYTARKMTTRND